jgi:hypothetical protein
MCKETIQKYTISSVTIHLNLHSTLLRWKSYIFDYQFIIENESKS